MRNQQDFPRCPKVFGVVFFLQVDLIFQPILMTFFFKYLIKQSLCSIPTDFLIVYSFHDIIIRGSKWGQYPKLWNFISSQILILFFPVRVLMTFPVYMNFSHISPTRYNVSLMVSRIRRTCQIESKSLMDQYPK